MTAKAEKVLFCWSGGKDSAMALHALRQNGEISIAGLLTTVTDDYDRVSMHGVRRALLLRQAEEIGLPLQEVRIPPQCVNPIYEARMKAAMARRARSAARVWQDSWKICGSRERNLALGGMKAVFPIWGRVTQELARDFWEGISSSGGVHRSAKLLARIAEGG